MVVVVVVSQQPARNDFYLHTLQEPSRQCSLRSESMADSLQTSLISSPVNLHITPLSEDTIPIIPWPILVLLHVILYCYIV